MNRNSQIRDLALSGLLIALGIIVPSIFHVFGGAGKVFLPMHIPVMIAGFLLPPYYSLVIGILTPALSTLLTGMPIAYPMLPIMIFELGTYGFVISKLRKVGIKNVFSRLIISMIFGRISAGIVIYVMSLFFGVKLNVLVYLKGSIITGIPGLIIQLIFIPVVVNLLENNTKLTKFNYE